MYNVLETIVFDKHTYVLSNFKLCQRENDRKYFLISPLPIKHFENTFFFFAQGKFFVKIPPLGFVSYEKSTYVVQNCFFLIY